MFSRFYVKLLTDRQTNAGHYITSLAVAALHQGAPGLMTWPEDPPPWLMTWLEVSTPSLRPAYCFASVIMWSLWTENKNDDYRLYLFNVNEWRTYDNTRQGADRLGLHPSWWRFRLKPCDKNATFATSIATRAVLATPPPRKHQNRFGPLGEFTTLTRPRSRLQGRWIPSPHFPPHLAPSTTTVKILPYLTAFSALYFFYFDSETISGVGACFEGDN